MKSSGFLVLGILLSLAACAGLSGPPPEKLTLTPVAYGDLPGWNADHQSAALAALTRSCRLLDNKAADHPMGVAGTALAWLPACDGLARLPPSDDGAARAFIENYFRPYAVAGRNRPAGLFTGYYEAELNGSWRKTKRYHVPLYARPRDLVTVDLGLFRPEWKGQHITGKVKGTHFVPYDNRAAIAKNSLTRRAKPLLWVDDPTDAFFLEIQGSGRVHLPNSRIVRLGYDGANGRAYVAIGRALMEMGLIGKPVTMQAIRAYLAAHPGRAQAIMNLNPSYVFFRVIKGEGPRGAEGVALTAERSLAVDPRFVPLGVPLWLDTTDGFGAPLQRLMVAQDTGGAIKGPVRGDFFWGAGPAAEAEAGAMQSQGCYYILLPNGVMPDAR